MKPKIKRSAEDIQRFVGHLEQAERGVAQGGDPLLSMNCTGMRKVLEWVLGDDDAQKLLDEFEAIDKANAGSVQ
jgi:hypothetical protein